MAKATFEYDPVKQEFRRGKARSPGASSRTDGPGPAEPAKGPRADRKPVRRRRRRSSTAKPPDDAPSGGWNGWVTGMWIMVGAVLMIWLAVILRESFPAESSEESPTFPLDGDVMFPDPAK